MLHKLNGGMVPCIMHSCVSFFFCLKGGNMEEKHLYLKRNGESFDFDMGTFDVSLMTDDMFLFNEAAVVILYPDVVVDS